MKFSGEKKPLFKLGLANMIYKKLSGYQTAKAIRAEFHSDMQGRIVQANQVSAILYFNETGELINFVSDDRSALQDDGTLRRARWSTPVSDYKELNGRRIPTYGETIWNYPEGDFTYGTFRLKNIEYNVPDYEPVKD